MRPRCPSGRQIAVFASISLSVSLPCFAQTAAPLPSGVKAVWDAALAHREKTSTRERMCINGLWRWQPAKSADGAAPSTGWGYFKVPGSWPGVTDYMQKDCQTVFPAPEWKNVNLSSIRAAWYQLEITIPSSWRGRRIAVTADYVNSFATVFLDGRQAGVVRFPAGEVDLTTLCRPGGKYVLSMLVEAMPLKAVRLSFTDTNAAREVPGQVQRRGLCGDVFLTSEPRGARINGVKIETSVQRGEMVITAALAGLSSSGGYFLRGEVRDRSGVIRHFASRPFKRSDLRDGRLIFNDKWMPEKLWDIHTPKNMLTANLTLVESRGRVVDRALPLRFGFREFTIQGRDFFLNGSRIYLSSVPLDNAQVGAAWASYEGAKESLLRLKSWGVNFVYTHNYDCEPGSHLSFDEILRAADDVGMLVALSQPHFSAYDWKSPDADRSNGYARHAAFYAEVARNHPSVVAYATSHNATSYDEAKNPDLIDGIYAERDNWSANNVKQALRAEAIIKRLDPSRIVYHHSSGNLGAMYTENFYTNFTPKQELAEWFGHWATKGVKPLFLCEFGVPITWDWTMYRGWYQGKREWGSANVPWDFSMAEWNAQFFGDRAYKITEQEKANIRWEAQQYRDGRTGWHRWDYPHAVGSGVFDMRMNVIADYIQDSWRALRTLGVSAFGPWEHEIFWRLKPGVDRSRKALPVDWSNLQRPGFSPDYLDARYERMDMAYERSDWEPTEAAKALIRNNRPLLAYIGGKPGETSSSTHIYQPGEVLEKQVVVVNNTRQKARCEAISTLELPQAIRGVSSFKVATGNHHSEPIRFRLPASLKPGSYQLTISVRFDQGEVQSDTFSFSVMPAVQPLSTTATIALFDPKGETAGLLRQLGVQFQPIEATTDLARFQVLVIGKGVLTLDGSSPDFLRVRTGLKVVLFEQTAEVLERRFGFRVAEYGLRNVLARVPGHPVLADLSQEHLRDWRGEATLLPPRLKYTLKPMYGPMVKWAGFDVPRAWRCGNRGAVASVLIEKPGRGDFLPIVDGGFSLQYSPLLQYRDGFGVMLFCQMDVTGRTQNDPAAAKLARNLIQYACDWKGEPRRELVYAGEPAGKAYLEQSRFRVLDYPVNNPANSLLVVGPGSESVLTRQGVRDWQESGGRIVAVGLDASTIQSLFPGDIQVRRAEHISSYFESAPAGSWRAGIAPADLHCRDPREVALIMAGAEIAGDGVIACTSDSLVAFCQLVPWQFDPTKMNQKRTFRRSSFLLTRLLCNRGGASLTFLLENAAEPVQNDPPETRWLDGLYLDTPEEWDDPYRFFPW